MKPDTELDRLFSAARAAGPDTSRVEAGLETRVLARIRADRVRRPWYAVAWRLVPLFTAATLAIGAWYVVSVPDSSADMNSLITAEYGDTLAQNFLNGD